MSTSNKGKFSERIRKIAYNRRNKKKDIADAKSNITRILLFPLMLIDKKIYAKKNDDLKLKNNIKDGITHSNYNRNNDIKETGKNKSMFLTNKKTVGFNNSQVKPYKNNYILNRKNSDVDIKHSVKNTNQSNTLNNDKLSDNKMNNIFTNSLSVTNLLLNNTLNKEHKKLDTGNVSSNKEDFSNRSVGLQSKDNVKQNIDISSKIISDISKYLIKNINNLETIESDLYVLSQFDGNKDSLEKCREYIAKLHALQNKLNKIRKQFNILKENVDFDDILEIDDKVLLDKLIEFRDSIDNNIAMQTTKNYKLLEEYKYLYSKIDKVVDDANALEKEVNNRKIELENANVDFNEFQNKVYGLDKIEEESSRMLTRQDEMLQKIADKVSDISVTTKIDYIYKGFLDIFLNSLKLFGLYIFSPFKKSIPGIAIATVATKKTMDNLIDAMQVEKRTRYIYSATNYGFELSSAISDLSCLDNMISSTLSDVSSMKREFISKFSPYAKDLPKYNNILKKINQMEKTMVNNQIKVRVLADKMRDKKRINEKTLVKVRKLNNN